MKKSDSFFLLAFFNTVITVFMVVFIWTTIFPKSTILENGDITINVRGLIIDHIEIQQFETNIDTIETNLVYWCVPVCGKSEIKICNEDITYFNNVMFYDGNEYKFTFGEVIAYPKRSAILIMTILYITITMYLMPYIFRKFTKFT